MSKRAQICIAIDIDLCDIGDDQQAWEQFRAFFRGSFIDTAKPIDNATRYDFKDFCLEMSLVVDYFLTYRFTDDPDAGIIGGFAFLLDDTYIFGADRQFALSRAWEHAFNRMHSSPVQTVHIDDRTYKIIKSEEMVSVKCEHGEWHCPLSFALSEFPAIINKKRNFEKEFLKQLKQKANLHIVDRIYKSCFGE